MRQQITKTTRRKHLIIQRIHTPYQPPTTHLITAPSRRGLTAITNDDEEGAAVNDDAMTNDDAHADDPAAHSQLMTQRTSTSQ